jgi:hypothetical protein
MVSAGQQPTYPVTRSELRRAISLWVNRNNMNQSKKDGGSHQAAAVDPLPSHVQCSPSLKEIKLPGLDNLRGAGKAFCMSPATLGWAQRKQRIAGATNVRQGGAT